jgi:DNA-binding XRE family transcriptional regulator
MHILQTYRKAHGLDRADLAHMLGISRFTVAAIETGNRRITPEKAKQWESIIKIERALLCPEAFGA